VNTTLSFCRHILLKVIRLQESPRYWALPNASCADFTLSLVTSLTPSICVDNVVLFQGILHEIFLLCANVIFGNDALYTRRRV
jgi:hypothetical protein